jgi:hypothetical protein
MDTNKLVEYLILWMAIMVVIAVARSRGNTPGVGLTLAYLLNLSIIHWVGAAIYVLPAYQGTDSRFTELGFEQTLYGVAAFAFGALVLTPLLANRGFLRRSAQQHQPDTRLPVAYIAAGVVSFTLTFSYFGRLPTATAIVSTGEQLVVAGLCLCCWKAWKEGNPRKLVSWLWVALLMPFTTVITQGFLGYGVVALLIVLIFVSTFLRSPVKIALIGIPLMYFGLSVFVSYMRDRGEIRAGIRNGESFSARVDRVTATAGTFEWFDPSNPDHLQRIDGRLNQNYLVGAAVARLSETDEFARGDTFWDALLALVPRALWPDKGIKAGSGDLVTRFTGIVFDTGTSVGVGQSLEFYGNFGTIGVLIGFVIMGTLITTVDWQAGQRLANSDLHGFVLWFLPGVSLLQVGGQLVELTAGAAASLIVALIVNRYLDRFQRKQKVMTTLPSAVPEPGSLLRNA